MDDDLAYTVGDQERPVRVSVTDPARGDLTLGQAADLEELREPAPGLRRPVPAGGVAHVVAFISP